MELSNILELIHAVSDSNLTQFNLQDGNLNISMSAEKTIVQQAAANADAVAFAAQYQTAVQPVLQSVPQSAVQNNAGAGASSSEKPLTGNIVKSPLVGTYYAASSPDSAPFVKVGDKVTKGQVLGIVEAMKLMNEIESEFDGTVKEILVENEQMVEFGQPMFVIEERKKEVFIVKLTTKEIMEIIPHRHPFLLIDTIEDLVPGVRATGKKCITYNEPQFAGHFPQEPIMPGVLIIEALAQTGAVAILSKPENKGKIAYFASINNAKFKNKVVPGDTLTLEVEIIKEKGPMGVGKAKATNQDGKVAVIAELTFAVGA